jgi:hypothetical protein
VSDNRRTTTRFDVWIEAKLTVNGTVLDTTMTNLSLGGALIAGTKQPMGQRILIAFRVPTLEDAIEIGGIVRWSDDKGVGLQFDGLRARDVWALNEYFKQLV